MSALLHGSVAWNPGAVTDQEELAQEITVTGAVLGDFVILSSSLDVADLTLTGQVTEAGIVTAILGNQTTGTPDPLTPTIRALVYSKSGLT